MRPQAQLVALLLCVAPCAATETSEVVSAPTDVRKELLSEYRFTPPQPEAHPQLPPPGTAPSAPPTASVADDVVRMAPFTVRETVRMNALTASLQEEKASAHTGMMMDKLGVGLHVVRIGKVGLFAGTVFYIPFVVGVGFSW